MPWKDGCDFAPHEGCLLSSAARKNGKKSPERHLRPPGGVEGCGHSDPNLCFQRGEKWSECRIRCFAMTSFGIRLAVLGAASFSQPLTKGDGGQNRPFKGGIVFNYHNIWLYVKKKINILCLFDFNMCRKLNFIRNRRCLPIKTAF
jgi:hypothetical protein